MRIEAIKCDHCGQLHEENSKLYLTVEGNIYVGSQGGIIGNNIDSDGNGTRIRKQTFCHKCLLQIIIDTLEHNKPSLVWTRN